MGNLLVQTAKTFAAGCCVYYAMAACGGSDGSTALTGGPRAGQGDDSSGGTAGPGPGSSTSSASSTSGSTSTSGSPVPNAMAEGYKSGSRLKLRYYEGSDGTVEFVTWFDTQRSEECQFRPHDDGTYRCIPWTDATISTLFYSDSGCAVPVSAISKGSIPRLYIATADALGTKYRIYNRGPIYGGPIYYGSPCTLYPSATAFDIYSLGPELPSSLFLSATIKTTP